MPPIILVAVIGFTVVLIECTRPERAPQHIRQQWNSVQGEYWRALEQARDIAWWNPETTVWKRNLDELTALSKKPLTSKHVHAIGVFLEKIHDTHRQRGPNYNATQNKLARLKESVRRLEREGYPIPA